VARHDGVVCTCEESTRASFKRRPAVLERLRRMGVQPRAVAQGDVGSAGRQGGGVARLRGCSGGMLPRGARPWGRRPVRGGGGRQDNLGSTRRHGLGGVALCGALERRHA
jgi:hypothetical protein